MPLTLQSRGPRRFLLAVESLGPYACPMLHRNPRGRRPATTAWTRLILGIAMMALPAQAKISSSFLETFGAGTFDQASWSPLNAGSSLSLPPASTDRNRMDGPNDGVLLVERGVGVTGNYGAVRSLGNVDATDVGASLSVDFAYERPADSFGNLKPMLLVAGRVVAEGATVSLFSSGEDPGAASGLYSAVRSALSYRIVADDLGKEMTLAIQYFDGDVAQNRDLAVDAVSLINSGDPIPTPQLAPAVTDFQGGQTFTLSYPRRIDPYLPGLAYTTDASDDLKTWTRLNVAPEDIQTAPLDAAHEQVTARVVTGATARNYYRVAVRNRRIGDPGVTFDAGKMDPGFPQMLVWRDAGVQGGVPYRESCPILKVITATNSTGINAAIAEIATPATSLAGGGILLREGSYTIDAKVRMRSDVRLIGERRDGVVLNVAMVTQTSPQETAVAIDFDHIRNAGLDNLTIRGTHGTPDQSVMENVKPEFMVTSVNLYYATNCWLDDLDIIDSGDHPVSSWRSTHVTVRGCTLDGAWNKGDGGRGYFQVQSDRFLIVYNRIRRLRHLALQKQYCEYNVVIRNFLEQDVNFHDDDNGNNLVEGNRSILPATLAANWHAMMGPWSVQHTTSRNDNFVFNNKCEERNNGGAISFSDTGQVYVGSRNHEQDGGVFATSSTVPTAGTFYPVILSSQAP